MLQHMAPRIIQHASFCSRAILTNTDVPVGCKQSVASIRVFFCSTAAPEVYVDDIAMITVGDEELASVMMSEAVPDFVSQDLMDRCDNFRMSFRWILPPVHVKYLCGCPFWLKCLT